MKLFTTLLILLSMVSTSVAQTQDILKNCPTEQTAYESCMNSNNETCSSTCMQEAQPQQMEGADLSQIDPAALDPKLICPLLKDTKCKIDACCEPCVSESDALWKCNLEFLKLECDIACAGGAATTSDGSTGGSASGSGGSGSSTGSGSGGGSGSSGWSVAPLVALAITGIVGALV